MDWRSRGYLPHYDGPGAVQHIVFGLADATPVEAMRRTTDATSSERAAAADAMLDAGYGRRTLADPRAAAIVQETLLVFDPERYHLLAWCVMPKHVHALVEVQAGWPLPKILHAWKSFTANGVNRRLGQSGALWAREYFDRAVRNEAHLEAVKNYIENNPVAAGLVNAPDAWRWSSASAAEALLPPGASSRRRA